jgi:hypothetical protein
MSKNFISYAFAHRKADVMIANQQALSPHHYIRLKAKTVSRSLMTQVVEDNGFEPLTLCVQGRCSSQLS